MCIPKAFLRQDGEKTLIMEDIQSIVWEDPTHFIMTDIIGNSKSVEGRILTMDLINHQILIEGNASD